MVVEILTTATLETTKSEKKNGWEELGRSNLKLRNTIGMLEITSGEMKDFC